MKLKQQQLKNKHKHMKETFPTDKRDSVYSLIHTRFRAISVYFFINLNLNDAIYLMRMCEYCI